MTTRLFVYGSLRAGEPNHALLAGARPLGLALSTPRFELVDLGPYPALVRARPGRLGVTVVGEIYEVSPRLLARLDAFEGVPELYVRAAIALVGGGRAEAYLMPRGRVTGRTRLASGDWCRRLAGPAELPAFQGIRASTTTE